MNVLRSRPARTAAIIALLLTAGVAEGVGVGALLPVLETALGTAGGDSALSRGILRLTDLLGLTASLGPLLVLAAGALVVKGVLRWLAMREVGRGVTRTGAELRRRLIRALFAARWDHFIGVPLGYFANAVGIDAYRAAFAYRRVCELLAASVQVLVYGVLAVLISWRLGLLMLLLGAVLVAALTGLVRAAQAAGEAQTAAGRAVVRSLTDALQALKPLKGMARETEVLGLLEQEDERLEASERRQVLANEALQAFQEPLLAVVLAVALYVTVARGGEPVASVLLMGFLMQRIGSKLHRAQSEYQQMIGNESAYRVLAEMADAAEADVEPTGGVAAPTLDHGIVLDDVSFAYERGAEVLSDVSIDIGAGDFTLLVGPSGAGKTTLLDLVVGLYRPASGTIRVDGIPLREIDPVGWRRRIGYVPQETALLHETVARNITAGDRSLGPDAVEQALREADAWEFVANMPEGTNTVIGERGLRLSGGQRRRLALARALAHRPALLVLDEPISDLDADTAAAIRRTLRKLRGRVTVLAVSHQPGLEPLADAVYHVKNGRVHRPDPVPA